MNSLAIEELPRAVEARCTADELVIRLTDGRTLGVPLAWFPSLLSADTSALQEIVLIGGGEGLHWPRIDEDISVAGLLSGKPSIQHLRRPA